MIILYISWRRFQNIWNKKIEPFLRTCYHGLKNFQKGFENNSSQEPPITAVLNFSMYSLLSVYVLSLNHGVYIIEKGYKKTVCPDGKYFHQNKLFFIFTLIIFSEHSYFLRKSQITPERKQRKKIFFNSICTPLEHPDSPQSLYLWAFSQFSPLFKLFFAKLFYGVFHWFGW